MKMNQKGFTLIELLIVIGIIGILSTIAIPNFQKFQAKAKQTEAKTMLAGLYTAEQAFFAEYSAYHTGLGTIGFTIDGNKRNYAVGFKVADANKPAIGAGALVNVPGALTVCGGTAGAAGDAFCAAAGLSASQLAPNVDSEAAVIDAGGQSFTAAAVGTLKNVAGGVYAVANEDRWTMTNTRILTNSLSGL